MKIKILLLCSIVGAARAQAQNMISMSSQHPAADTLPENGREQALRYPGLRRANVTTTIFGSGHFDSKLNGEHFASGKSQNARISSFFNVPISRWGSNELSGTIYH
ncbi:MAG TPA: hypothetical protein VIM87_23255, partial [Chitinophaga sp.]|uniref:hypothetical protein n=1 Tax=Chitinophaga sp. TaxID=1869181 RepID=UPI002F9332FA